MIDPADAYYFTRDFPEPDPCHFCGGPTPCECTSECHVCGHIGHEHYSDGRCRGTNYDGLTLIEEECPPHIFVPRSVRPS